MEPLTVDVTLGSVPPKIWRRRLLASLLWATVLTTLLLARVAHTDTDAPWEPDLAMQLGQGAEVEQQLQLLLELAQSRSADALVDALQALRDGATLSAPARERVLYEFVLALRGLAPDRTLRRALEMLSEYTSEVQVPLENSRSSQTRPLYRIAAAARGTLTTWDRHDATHAMQQWLADIVSGRPRQQTEALPWHELAAVLETAPVSQLEAAREVLRSELSSKPEAAAAVAVLARRLRDPALYRMVLMRGEQRSAIRLLQTTRQLFPPRQSYSLLQAGVERAPLASAALMELGKLIGEYPAARIFLVEMLSHPRLGGSAASALASADDAATLQALSGVLQQSTDPLLQARTALALRMNGSPQARAALIRFVQDSATSGQLHREVRAWLEE